jgi:predicted DNA-binding protein
MARLRKVLNSRNRSFLLPGELLGRIEQAAEKRKIDASEVVREMLDAHIAEYTEKAQAVWRGHLRQAVDAVKTDPAVKAAFEECKEKKQLLLPLDTGLDKNQVMVLKEALEAHRDLQITEPKETEHGLERVVQELIDVAGNQRTKNLLQCLNPLFADGLLSVEVDEEGKMLCVREPVQEEIDQNEQAKTSVNSLRRLIKKNVFELTGANSRRHTVNYRFNPQDVA